MPASDADNEHEQNVTSADILKAITSLKQNFHQKIDGVQVKVLAKVLVCFKGLFNSSK